jgi:hypothetical protein
MAGFSYERFSVHHKTIFKAALAERTGTTAEQIKFTSVSDVPTPAPTPSGMQPTRLLGKEDSDRQLQIIDSHLQREKADERALLAPWCWCSGIIIQLQVTDCTKDKGDDVIQDINVIISAPQDFDAILLRHYLVLDDETVQAPPNMATSVTMVPYLQRHYAAGTAEAAWWKSQTADDDKPDDGPLLISSDRHALSARYQMAVAAAISPLLALWLAAAS